MWTDKASEVAIRWSGDRGEAGQLALSKHPSDAGLHMGFAPEVTPGTSYEVLIDGVPCVAPFARALPRGVHGSAEVAPVPRKCMAKRAILLERGEVFYELHVGTFRAAGTFASVKPKPIFHFMSISSRTRCAEAVPPLSAHTAAAVTYVMTMMFITLSFASALEAERSFRLVMCRRELENALCDSRGERALVDHLVIG